MLAGCTVKDTLSLPACCHPNYHCLHHKIHVKGKKRCNIPLQCHHNIANNSRGGIASPSQENNQWQRHVDALGRTPIASGGASSRSKSLATRLSASLSARMSSRVNLNSFARTLARTAYHKPSTDAPLPIDQARLGNHEQQQDDGHQRQKHPSKEGVVLYTNSLYKPLEVPLPIVELIFSV